MNKKLSVVQEGNQDGAPDLLEKEKLGYFPHRHSAKVKRKYFIPQAASSSLPLDPPLSEFHLQASSLLRQPSDLDQHVQ